MKINALKYKSGSGVKGLLDLIAKASESSDIVVAPDYALAFDLDNLNSIREREFVEGRLAEISKSSRNAILIPGTMPVYENKKLKLICPIYQDGNLIKIMQKETDRGEEKLAEKYGLIYERGDCNNNHFRFNSDKVSGSIAVEICSDHGKQKIPENTILELILAYDKNEGFYMNINTQKFARNIIVCDGYHPKVDGFRIDENGKLNIVNPIVENGSWRIYNL